MNRTLSKRQQQILDYIRKEIDEKGYPPTVREIRDAMGLNSTSTVHGHLEKLEKNGYIRRDSTKPRCIEIVENPKEIEDNNQYKIIQSDHDTPYGIAKDDYVLIKNKSPKEGDIVAIKNNYNISFKFYAELDVNVSGVVEGVFRRV